MSRAIIRPLPIYLNGKKVAEVSDGNYDIDSGDEIQIGSEGVIGLSDGTPVASAQFNCIIPVKGMSVTVDTMLLNKQYIDFGIPVNGKFHQVTGRITNGGYSWDHKSGKCMGQFKFIGGGPVVTG